MAPFPGQPIDDLKDAQTDFEELIARVKKGEEIVIARDGRPVARRLHMTAPKRVRAPGLGKNAILYMAEQFDNTSEKIIRDVGM